MSIRLTWEDVNPGEDGFRIYRAESTIDPQALPPSLAALAPDIYEFEDSGVTPGVEYFYRVSVFKGSLEVVSEEVSIIAAGSNDPGTFAQYDNIGVDAVASGDWNEEVAYGDSSGQTSTMSATALSSGKWYWEVLGTASSDTPCRISVGVGNSPNPTVVSTYPGYNTDGWGYNGFGVYLYDAAVVGASVAPANTGDIVGCLLDLDSGIFKVAINGVEQGSGLSLPIPGDFYIAIADGNVSRTFSSISNFGQDSSFLGNETAQSNTDENGFGDFYYEPPAGFLSVCSSNLASS